MKQICFLLTLALLIGTGCKTNQNSSNKPLSAGSVNFDVIDINNGVEVMTGDKLLLEFSPELTRMKDEPVQMGNQILFIDNKSQEQTVYLDMPGDKKIALALGTAKEAENIEYKEETKEIAGYKCKKAIVKFMGQETEVYYTKEIPVRNAFGFSFDGFLMEYASPGPEGGKKIFRANKVDTKAVALTLPEGYESKTMEEFQKEMRNQGPPISKDLEVGAQFKDFTAKDMDGNTVTLADLKGKVVVINFWFVACQPCIMELPQLNDVVEKYKGKDVEFIAVTFDKKDKVKNLIDKKEFNYRLINDEMNMVRSYGVAAFPTNIVLDKTGKIIKSKLGFSPVIGEELSESIDAALK